MHTRLPSSLVLTLLTLLPPTSAEAPASTNASLLWGPYRPNLYLGIRPRVPESLLMGLMWGRLEAGEGSLRHVCEEGKTGAYGWTAYDSRSGGTQSINDPGNAIRIETEFVKKHEGQGAGNWGLRVRGIPAEDAVAGMKTSVVFYVAMEAMHTSADRKLEARTLKKGQGDDRYVDSVDLDVKHPTLGAATIHIPNPIEFGRAAVHQSMFVKSVNVTEDDLWHAKTQFLDVCKGQEAKENSVERFMIPNESGKGNMHFVQMVLQDNFEFDILYSSKAATRALVSEEFTREIQSTVDSFQNRFAKVFAPQPPFQDISQKIFAYSMLSNLLGGLGYFHGTIETDTSNATEYQETDPHFWEQVSKAQAHAKPQSQGPYELLSHVPSRPKFPRGFLWDEGFHLLAVLEWDVDLTVEVIRSWLALIDDDGWIAREQILGPEANASVPVDFQIQYPHIANPPTMFLVISALIDKLMGKSDYAGHPSLYVGQKTGAERVLLEELYPLLKRHYDWFRRTQAGDVESHSVPKADPGEGYRWRGRSPETNYASGLDDFPRAEPPDPSELHLDALCWVGVMARTLSKVAKFLDRGQDNALFEKHTSAIARNVEDVHWSEKKSMYCDTVMRDGSHSYVCPEGYVALFPFMTGFLGPDHAHLNATLSLIRSDQLWSHYGLRSLTPQSTRYGKGDNYWRGAIWININYLVIERLLELATTPGPLQDRCRSIYSDLRKNLVDNVYSSWLETGFAWEQYNDQSGKGQRTQHFTGWTALVVKVMAMPDLQTKGIKEHIGTLVEQTKLKEGGTWSVRGAMMVPLVLGLVWVFRKRIRDVWKRAGSKALEECG